MALEDGGITRKQINGSNTGVIIGSMNDHYKVMANSDLSKVGGYNATGTASSVLAARVSYVYNLHGTCLTLDTACSSALIAIHLACQSIKTGDCNMVICGGVGNILKPLKALCEACVLSATGQCQPCTTDGHSRREGCGIVILKSLKAAIADGNKIWATIKTGSNQDDPVAAPSSDKQEHLYNTHNSNPSDMQYLEPYDLVDNTKSHKIKTYIDMIENLSRLNLTDKGEDKDSNPSLTDNVYSQNMYDASLGTRFQNVEMLRPKDVRSRMAKISGASLKSQKAEILKPKKIAKLLAKKNKDILETGRFQRQTSRGWDHNVEVVLSKQDGRIVLEWGKEGRIRRNNSKMIDLKKLKYVSMRELNGLPTLIITTKKKTLVLKTPDRFHAERWMEIIRRSSRNPQLPKLHNKSSESEGIMGSTDISMN